jgi:hypothetical protein
MADRSREEIVRNDINRTLRRGGKPLTPTDQAHTKELKGQADPRKAAVAKATKAAADAKKAATAKKGGKK